MSLKVEIVFLILVVRSILKKPTSISRTFIALFLKNISLLTATPLLVIGHARQSGNLYTIMLLMKMV